MSVADARCRRHWQPKPPKLSFGLLLLLCCGTRDGHAHPTVVVPSPLGRELRLEHQRCRTDTGIWGGALSAYPRTGRSPLGAASLRTGPASAALLARPSTGPQQFGPSSPADSRSCCVNPRPGQPSRQCASGSSCLLAQWAAGPGSDQPPVNLPPACLVTTTTIGQYECAVVNRDRQSPASDAGAELSLALLVGLSRDSSSRSDSRLELSSS